MARGRSHCLACTASGGTEPFTLARLRRAFSSPDLMHWTKHPQVLEAAAVRWAKKAMRALAIVARGGKYYFFFSASDIHSEEEVGGIGMAVADHPAWPLHRGDGRAVRALPGAALERISTRSGIVRLA